MQMSDWVYSDHALITITAPHKCPDTSKIEDGTIWKEGIGKKAIFARWTSNYDDDRYQDWWYTVYDKPLDFAAQKKSHRRKIRKGLANFECRVIDPADYAEELARITMAAFTQYPAKYRPTTSYETLVDRFKKLKDLNYITIGCFYNGEKPPCEVSEGTDAAGRIKGALCAYDYIEDCGGHWMLAVGKVDPAYEHGTEANAAITYTELTLLKDDVLKGKYICNGQRNMRHETNYNEDLVHWYGFRKVPCRLNIAYNPKFKWIVMLLYPFRRVLKLLNGISLVNDACVVLNMEEIRRKQRKIKE